MPSKKRSYYVLLLLFSRQKRTLRIYAQGILLTAYSAVATFYFLSLNVNHIKLHTFQHSSSAVNKSLALLVFFTFSSSFLRYIHIYTIDMCWQKFKHFLISLRHTFFLNNRLDYNKASNFPLVALGFLENINTYKNEQYLAY